MFFEREKLKWEQESRKKVELSCRSVTDCRAVIAEADPAAWQGVVFHPSGNDFRKQALHAGGPPLFLEFVEALVGKVSFRFQWRGKIPLELHLHFAEQPYEATADLGHYKGSLSKFWLQEKTMILEPDGDLNLELPERFSFRYIRIEVLKGDAPLFIAAVRCLAQSAAQHEVNTADGCFNRIDEVGLCTLRNCMQNLFEDGPKRDRRLWTGDLRLQGLVNGVTYKNFELFERCLFLLASGMREDGLFPAAVFDHNDPYKGEPCYILDYALLLPSILLEHLKSSGNREICLELYPVAKHQLDIAAEYFDATGRFRNKQNIWIFIDWNISLERDCAITGIFVFALKQLAALAEILGQQVPERCLQTAFFASRMRETFFDEKKGIFTSGDTEQISFASQIWAVISGVLTPEESRIALRYCMEHECVKPQTPYLWHYFIEALIHCGEYIESIEVMRNYWGGMVSRGANTFWEVYVPDNALFSPYGDPLVNSACHAWSCTPSYFLRLKEPEFQKCLKEYNTKVEMDAVK